MAIPYLNYPKRKKMVQTPNKIISRTEAVTRYFKTDDGQPFLFEGREYLEEIYNNKHQYLVLVASRQAEKSSFLAKDMLLETVFNKSDSLLYVSASQDQVDEFVNNKINAQFQMNQDLKKHCFNVDTKNNSKLKSFSNGSKMSFRSVGASPNSARGLSVRKIYFDEVQSIPKENVPVVTECSSHYTDKAETIYTGTPFSTRNILSTLYTDSCQKEWIIRCRDCAKDNPPLGISHIDLDLPFLFCVYCKKPIYPKDGRWVAQNPDSEWDGYRICRLMTPNCAWRTKSRTGVLDKYEIYPEAKFYQEVLGLPLDQGTQPISEQEVYANCGDTQFIDVNNPPESIKQIITFGAIDWSYSVDNEKAYTIFTIARFIQGRIEILYVKRFSGPEYHDPDKILGEMQSAFNKVNVDIVATDFGVGHLENLRFRKMVKAKVCEMMYGPTLKEWEFKRAAKSYLLGRTMTMDLVIHRLKRGLYLFPRRDVIEPFASDIMNVSTEYDIDFKSIKYVPSGSGPDDFIHLLNYLGVIIERYFGEYIR
jgi:hypothetical protein